MEDRNISEKFRKPRQTRGTPLHTTRNYYFFGLVAFSGLCWYLYDLWPESHKLMANIKAGKFGFPKDFKDQMEINKFARGDLHLEMVLNKVKQKLDEKEKEKEEPKPQSTVSKLLSSTFKQV